MAEAKVTEKKPTNPPKAAPKSGEPPIEERVDYQLGQGGAIIRTKDGVHIPNDPNNPDRAAYEAWAMAGGVAIPADKTADELRVEAEAKAPKAKATDKPQAHNG